MRLGIDYKLSRSSKNQVEEAGCLFLDDIWLVGSFLQNFQDMRLLLGDLMDVRGQGMDGDQRLVIAFCAGVRGSRLDVLTDDNNGQQHQLQERLGDPGNNNNGVMGSDGSRKRDESKECEYVRAPHRTDDFGNAHRQTSVDPAHHMITMDILMNVMAQDQSGHVGSCMNRCWFV